MLSYNLLLNHFIYLFFFPRFSAEDNPLNEYPDEETSSNEEETESRTSADDSEDKVSVTSNESFGDDGGLKHHDDLFEDEIYGDDDGQDYSYDFDVDGSSDDQSNYY